MYDFFSDILFDVVYVFWYTCLLTNETDPKTQRGLEEPNMSLSIFPLQSYVVFT